MYKTYQPKKSEVKRNWHLIDAKDQVLGRMATEIVKLLMGKHKPTYSAHMDSGDYVVVINTTQVVLTGKKVDKKVYYSHSGHPGGFKETKFAKLFSEQPQKVVIRAVAGMLPDNRLKAKRLARLKIFLDEKHTYSDKFKTQNLKVKTDK